MAGVVLVSAAMAMGGRASASDRAPLRQRADARPRRPIDDAAHQHPSSHPAPLNRGSRSSTGRPTAPRTGRSRPTITCRWLAKRPGSLRRDGRGLRPRRGPRGYRRRRPRPPDRWGRIKVVEVDRADDGLRDGGSQSYRDSAALAVTVVVGAGAAQVRAVGQVGQW